MSTDADLLAWLLKAAVYLVFPLTFLALVVWTRIAGSALVEHARTHHPREWREAGGPEPGPVMRRWLRPGQPKRPAPWDRQWRLGAVAWAWTWALPRRAQDCGEFRHLQQRSRAAYFVPLAVLIALAVTVQFLP